MEMPSQFWQAAEVLQCCPVEELYPGVHSTDLYDHVINDRSELGPRVVGIHELHQRRDQTIRASAPAKEIVDVVEALGDVVLLSAVGFLPRATPRRARSDGRRCALQLIGLHTRAIGDLPSGGRLPQRREGQIDPALLGWQGFEVALEVGRVVVDEIKQVRQESPETIVRTRIGRGLPAAVDCRR